MSNIAAIAFAYGRRRPNSVFRRRVRLEQNTDDEEQDSHSISQYPTDEMNSNILWPRLSAGMEKTKIAVATTLTIA